MSDQTSIQTIEQAPANLRARVTSIVEEWMMRLWKIEQERDKAEEKLDQARDQIDELHRELAGSSARISELQRTNEHLREQLDASMKETVSAITEAAHHKARIQIGHRALQEDPDPAPLRLAAHPRPRPVS